MARPRTALLAVVGVISAMLTGLVAVAAPASAVQATQPTVVNAVPASFTPDVNNGTVFSIGQVAGVTYIGGSFTSVSPHGSSTAFTHNYVAAFNASTGALDNTNFLPTVNGEVDSIIPGPAAGEVYIAGSFTQVDGVAMKVALLNTSNGSLVSTWKPSAMNGAVNKLVLRNNLLFAGGLFTTVGGVSHVGLTSLTPTTGKVTPYVSLSFTGQHNYGTQCNPATSTCSNAGTGVKALDIDPSGTHLVAIGNFTCVATSCTGSSDPNYRDQVAMISLGTTSATLDTAWATAAYTAQCYSFAYDSYIRDVQFSPDGSYFVIAATGGSGTNSDGTKSSCDSAARYETAGTGSDVRPSWIDYTGNDTFLSLALTGPVVYVGGHQRWVNNSLGLDSPGPGAIPRPGIVALDPINGMPLSWNPGRNPRGAGAYALLATSTGLYVGSDTDYIGNSKYLHKKIAYFPLAGGETLPTNSTPNLPGRVYTAGGFPAPGSTTVLYRLNEGGPTIPAIDNGPDWQGDNSGDSPYRNSGSNVAGYGPVANISSTVPSTTPSAIFSSERWDPGSHGDGDEMHFGFPVPAGEKVEVRLYLANRCSCTSAVGQRVFDVNIDGQTFLNHFDMVAAAGDQTGMMESDTVTSDGEVDIDFAHETENPAVDGIEIVKDSPATTTYPASIYRINAGGSEIAATDGSAADWLQDNNNTTLGDPGAGTANGTPFRTGGNTESYADNPWAGTTNASVPASTPTDVFSTGKWGNEQYQFPVDPGTPVNVNLYLANNYPGTSQAGQRVFNVAIDGQPVLTNYDIVADAGNLVGEMKSFPVVAPASGEITVTLTQGPADNPVVNAIDVQQTGPTTTTPSDPNRISYRHVVDNGDGTATVGSEQNVTGSGINWGAIRGGFMVNGELIYGKNDGNLYERTFNGTTFGPEVALDPYDDPNWDNVQTGSGQTFQGTKPTFFGSELGSVTSMFYANGRMFYTVAGQSQMFWRWFEPESGAVGADEFTINDGNNWSGVAGAFLSGSTLYFADKSSGQLESVPWTGTQAGGTPTVLTTGDTDWASRAMFMLDDATHPNQPPVAAFQPTCSTTTTSCTFDASSSLDPDGSITDYAWTFGDGSAEDHSDASLFSHNYSKAGSYTVTLTVTDNDGATATKTIQVSAGQATPVPTFKGAVTTCSSGTAACGKSTTTTVAVPPGTTPGDALLLFVTWPATTDAATVPAGWHLLDKDVSSPLESDVYYRAATAADASSGTVSVNFATATKNGITLADYSGAAPGSIEAYAKSTDSGTLTHVTPTVAVTTPGSLAVSYWADKSSTTTKWTLPAGVTSRSSFYDTGSAFITAQLADSGGTVGTGNYGGKSATTNAASGKGVEWTIILSPAGSTPNQPPTAVLGSTCTGLSCSFDGSGSSDSDGTIATYSWNFGGDGTSTAESPNHMFSAPGTYSVQLTVTDNDGATNVATKSITVSPAAAGIAFVGSASADVSGTSASVVIPAATSAGDTLLMFESFASTTVTSPVPSGWTLVGTKTASNLTTDVYEKTASGSDGGSSAAVTFSASVKASLVVSDYSNAAASPIEGASSVIGSGTSHSTPALTGLSAGTWVVSYWTDKSTTTTKWTPPATVTQRAATYGTSSAADSALVADSAGPVSGNYPAQTATTDASSGSSVQWAIGLSPAS
ncbi:MAG TPA: PKD domain-containing protein [Mycobacteriales bacterium]|nr:PKD domain-containing protein [Mycobacteriales bacterium]